jgi:hypothetical protein
MQILTPVTYNLDHHATVAAATFRRFRTFSSMSVIV